jgi:hypothetical protein
MWVNTYKDRTTEKEGTTEKKEEGKTNKNSFIVMEWEDGTKTIMEEKDLEPIDIPTLTSLDQKGVVYRVICLGVCSCEYSFCTCKYPFLL